MVALSKPPRFRFPRDRRLRRRNDYLRVQATSARVTTPHFVLLLSAQPSQSSGGPCRIGIVASKKVGIAVVRNRAKRLLREAFRTRPELYPSDVDLLVIARPGAADLSYAAVCNEIQAVARLVLRRAREVLRK